MQNDEDAARSSFGYLHREYPHRSSLPELQLVLSTDLFIWEIRQLHQNKMVVPYHDLYILVMWYYSFKAFSS